MFSVFAFNFLFFRLEGGVLPMRCSDSDVYFFNILVRFNFAINLSLYRASLAVIWHNVKHWYLHRHKMLKHRRLFVQDEGYTNSRSPWALQAHSPWSCPWLRPPRDCSWYFVVDRDILVIRKLFFFEFSKFKLYHRFLTEVFFAVLSACGVVILS